MTSSIKAHSYNMDDESENWFWVFILLLFTFWMLQWTAQMWVDAVVVALILTLFERLLGLSE